MDIFARLATKAVEQAPVLIPQAASRATGILLYIDEVLQTITGWQLAELMPRSASGEFSLSMMKLIKSYWVVIH